MELGLSPELAYSSNGIHKHPAGPVGRLDRVSVYFTSFCHQEKVSVVARISTSEELQILKAVCEFPGDDTPRLMYADYLDDFATAQEATGTPPILTQTDRARAELIRLQCALARGPNCPVCEKTGFFRGPHAKWCEINAIDIGTTNIGPQTPVVEPCPKCHYKELHDRERSLLEAFYPVAGPINSLHSFDSFGGTLPKLKGRELWAPVELMSASEYRYTRGFVGVVSYPAASWFMRAAQVVKTSPIEFVVLKDRILNDAVRPFGSIGYFWVDEQPTQPGEMVSFDYPGSVIPKFLWVLANEVRDKDRAETVQDCYKWLSWACIKYARREAGLPDWLPQSECRPVGRPTARRGSGGTALLPARGGLPHFLTREQFFEYLPSIAFGEALDSTQPEWHHYRALQGYHISECIADAGLESP